MKHNYIALGWPETGDLGLLTADREAFKKRLAEVYPKDKPGSIPVNAGQLFRFVYEMQAGDLVVYPSKLSREIHIGQVVGPYQYKPSLNRDYPNVRPIKWLRKLPRTSLTQGALYEIGSAMSFFQIKNYADEIIAKLQDRDGTPSPPVDDDTVVLVAQDIEQTTSDFILKQLFRELKGHGLAGFVAHLLEKMGYHTRVSPPGPDGGIDIIAHKDELGFEPPIIKVQVKSGEGNVALKDVQALSANVDSPSEYGLFVTISDFTNPASNFARGKSNLRLINGEELIGLLLEYYEELDSRYKSLIPLKRVYIPQPLEDS